MPTPVGCIGLTSDSRLILGLKTGVYYCDPTTGRLEFIVNPEPDRLANRLNDGRVGPDGSFWVGSMHDALPRAPTGALYRITPDGTCLRVLDGLCVSNGLAWSPNSRRMYHSDSRVSADAGQINVYDFDPRSGALGPGKVFAKLNESQGLPDGAAMDRDGTYWSAGITAGCLNGFSPEGEIIRSIKLRAKAPTMPCFGGPNLTTLFVTSLTRQHPDGIDRGGLFRGELGCAGLAEPRFGQTGREFGCLPRKSEK